MAPADFELNESDEISDLTLKKDVLVEKDLKGLPEHRKIVESDIVGWVNDGFVIEKKSQLMDPRTNTLFLLRMTKQTIGK